jgi:hypothetical protein
LIDVKAQRWVFAHEVFRKGGATERGEAVLSDGAILPATRPDFGTAVRV